MRVASSSPAATQSRSALIHRSILPSCEGPRLLPLQVIVVEDENGNIVRETMKDTDTLARYKTMHETLVYLSHFDHEDTEQQMLSKLHLQVLLHLMPQEA